MARGISNTTTHYLAVKRTYSTDARHEWTLQTSSSVEAAPYHAVSSCLGLGCGKDLERRKIRLVTPVAMAKYLTETV